MVSRLAEHEAHPPERGGENLVVVGQGPQRLDDAGLDIDEGVRVDAGRRAIRLRKDDVEGNRHDRSEEHKSELQSLMRISYAVFCLKKKNSHIHIYSHNHTNIELT